MRRCGRGMISRIIRLGTGGRSRRGFGRRIGIDLFSLGLVGFDLILAMYYLLFVLPKGIL